MQDDDLKPESETLLDALLDEAVEAEQLRSDAVDHDLFYARLQNRIGSSRTVSRKLQWSAAALVLLGVLTWSLQDRTTNQSATPLVSNHPGRDVLQILDVLELLAPLEPSIIAQLDPAHFDTLEGFDSDMASLPLELLVTEGEER